MSQFRLKWGDEKELGGWYVCVCMCSVHDETYTHTHTHTQPTTPEAKIRCNTSTLFSARITLFLLFFLFFSKQPFTLQHSHTRVLFHRLFSSSNNNNNNMVLVSSLRPPQDLPSLCTIVVSTLWVQYYPSSSSTKAVQQQLWDDARRLEFHTYCQSILSYLNISPSVIYTRYIIDNMLKKEHRRRGR